MTDYKKIADGDPGGELEAAYNSMIAETEQSPIQGEYRVTLTTISKKLGRDAARLVNAKLKQAVADGHMDQWELDELYDDGFDLNDPETKKAIAKLKQEGALGETEAAALLGMAMQSVPLYPGLEMGHLQNAREMRERGEI